VLMNPMIKASGFLVDHSVDDQLEPTRVMVFSRDWRNLDVAREYRKAFGRTERIGLGGESQEKTAVLCSEKCPTPRNGIRKCTAPRRLQALCDIRPVGEETGRRGERKTGMVRGLDRGPSMHGGRRGNRHVKVRVY